MSEYFLEDETEDFDENMSDAQDYVEEIKRSKLIKLVYDILIVVGFLVLVAILIIKAG